MADLTDTAPVKEGEIIAGKYRVERLLGAGGMGVVIAATHLQLGRPVALKMMLPSVLFVPGAVERFQREAQASVQLRGEHVAQVLDVGALPDGAPYLVMELLEGSDLGTLLQEGGPLPAPDAVDFVIQACEAVAEAHALGIVHRDLKPRNLFLTRRVDRSPLVKVLDFGISKFSPKGSEGHSLTRTSDVVGSPNYMSPEQIRSAKAVDARTDIWSLGVILYELLTAQVPFVADSLPALCSRVLEEAPTPLTELRPEIPAGLWIAIAKCLEKAPADRYSSVQALVDAIAPFSPPRSQVSIGRVRATTVHPSSPPSAPAPAASSGSSGARVYVSHGTSISWADTVAARIGRRRIAMSALGLVLVLGVGAASVTALRPSSDAAHGESSSADAGLAVASERAATALGTATSTAPTSTSGPPVVTAAPHEAAATARSVVPTSPSRARAQVATASTELPGARAGAVDAGARSSGLATATVGPTITAAPPSPTVDDSLTPADRK